MKPNRCICGEKDARPIKTEIEFECPECGYTWKQAEGRIRVTKGDLFIGMKK